nr:cytochrome b [Rhabdopleura sp. NHMO H2136]
MGYRDSLGAYAFDHFITDVKCPINMSYMWSFGSILGVGLLIQIVTGMMLAIYFVNTSDGARNSMIHLEQDVVLGWFLRSLHVNGASFLFICMYTHVGRSMFYSIHCHNSRAWFTGVGIMILCWASAFFGYVLPWGQMSFWGATVITNLFTTIPFFGQQIVDLLWGGFVISGVTLKRFYVFHFLCPIIMGLGVLFHMWVIHQQGSTNPVFRWSVVSVNFHPLFTYKDMIGFWGYISLLLGVCLFVPALFSDPVNLVPADPFKTPHHIVPEWYFLYFYGVLRSIPSKSWGALAVVGMMGNFASVSAKVANEVNSNKFRLWGWLKYWIIVSCFLIITFYGAAPAGSPYEDALRVIMLIQFSVLKNWGPYVNVLEHYSYHYQVSFNRLGTESYWLSSNGSLCSYGFLGEKVHISDDVSSDSFNGVLVVNPLHD